MDDDDNGHNDGDVDDGGADDDDNGHDDDERDADKDMCRDGTTRRKLVLTSCNETEFSCHQSGKVLISSFLSFFATGFRKRQNNIRLDLSSHKITKTYQAFNYESPNETAFFCSQRWTSPNAIALRI